jgi:hypothetical protein
MLLSPRTYRGAQNRFNVAKICIALLITHEETLIKL